MTRITLRQRGQSGAGKCHGQRCWYREDEKKHDAREAHQCPFALTKDVTDNCNCCEQCEKECACDARDE